MTIDEINARINEWCKIDSEFAKFIKNCNKQYWMYDKEKVLHYKQLEDSYIFNGARILWK